ncbi:DUF1672 family protein [Guptibacillus hwajinpoensis]|uniref:DUF1672 family protein n=1 Tax=Guptibacillus hwajinpoensis TaxID=208199 RepID=UPI00384C0666
MTKKRLLLTGILCSALLLGGCSALTNSNEETEKEKEQKTDKKTEEERIEDKYFVSVQDYTGEGYTLDNGEETDRIAEENRDEVERAIKKYFKDEYKTEVKVHNIVGAIDGATVFVESVGNPHFYSYAIIPIDKDKKEVDSEGVWSQEGQVETAIVSGLYAWIYETEFKELNKFLENIAEEYPVIGINEEANENVRGSYFLTPYYKVTVYGGLFKDLLPDYIQHPNWSRDDWQRLLDSKSLDASMTSITIQMYMEKPDVDPDKKVFEEIVNKITEKDNIPAGNYSFILHDNTIDKTSAQNNKQNSLKKGAPNYIVKE